MNDPGNHEIGTSLGVMAANLQNLTKDTEEIKKDVKSFARFQVQTEERLSRGVDSFRGLDQEIDGMDKRLDGLHDEHVKLKSRVPRGWIVYAMLVIGFALISFLVSFDGGKDSPESINAAEILQNAN